MDKPEREPDPESLFFLPKEAVREILGELERKKREAEEAPNA